MDNKKIDKGKIIVIVIGLMLFLVGIIVGALLTYDYMVKNEPDREVNDKTEEDDGTESLKNNYVEGCINSSDYAYSFQYDYDYSSTTNGMFGIEPNLIDSKNVEFNVNGSVFEPVKGSVTYSTVGSNNYKFTYTSTKEISSVFLGGFGQGISEYAYIFLIMKDGTLQYKPIFNKHIDASGNPYYTTDINENVKLSGFKTLEGVKDGIKLVGANKSFSNGSGVWTTLLFVDQDSFYDLESYFVK